MTLEFTDKYERIKQAYYSCSKNDKLAWIYINSIFSRKMKRKKIKLSYDEEGDYLEIYFGNIKEGYFKEIGNKCFERIDKKTGNIGGYAIFNFTKRKDKFIDLEL